MKAKIKKQPKKAFNYDFSKSKQEPMLLMDSQALTMSSQGQITIPKAWREILDFEPGEKLLALVKDSKLGKSLTLRAKPKSWADVVSGTAKGAWGKTKKEIDGYVKKSREEWKRE